jgi:hypothetical protein
MDLPDQKIGSDSVPAGYGPAEYHSRPWLERTIAETPSCQSTFTEAKTELRSQLAEFGVVDVITDISTKAGFHHIEVVFTSESELTPYRKDLILI